MSREDFDQESVPEQKRRMAKHTKLMGPTEKEDSLSFDPIEVNTNLSKVQRFEFLSKMKNWCVGRFDMYDTWRYPYEELWNEIYTAYHAKRSSSKVKTRSKMSIPIVFQIIESGVPKFVNTLFSTDDFFGVKPYNPDNIQFAPNIKKLIQYQFRMCKFFPKFVDYTKQLMLYGTSYLKVHWIVKRKWVWERTPIRKDVSFFGQKLGSRIVDWREDKIYKVVERRPEIEVVDILDVYPHPEAENEQQEQYGFFIRSWVSLEQFKKMGAGKFPMFANTDSHEIGKGSKEIKGDRRQVRAAARGGNTPFFVRENNVELISYHGPYDVDGDGIEEDAHIVIANRNMVVKAQGNPFHHQKRPLIRGTMFPVVKEWYGMGLVEPILGLTHELDTLRRQRLDNINLMINRMWLIDGGANIDLDSLFTSPNGIITREAQDSIEPLEQKDVTQNAYIEAAQVQQDIENTAVPRSVQGTPESGRLGRTARGAQLIISQALEKFGASLRLTEEQVLEPLLDMTHALNGQFIDEDMILQDPDLYGGIWITGTQPTPEQIRVRSKFELKSISDMIQAEAQINQMMSFVGFFRDWLKPETVQFIMRTVWKLMNRSEKELDNLKAQAPVQQQPGQAGQGLQGQVQNQGTVGAPPQVPGGGPQ